MSPARTLRAKVFVVGLEPTASPLKVVTILGRPDVGRIDEDGVLALYRLSYTKKTDADKLVGMQLKFGG